jgi:hypothetical protein
MKPREFTFHARAPEPWALVFEPDPLMLQDDLMSLRQEGGAEKKQKIFPSDISWAAFRQILDAVDAWSWPTQNAGDASTPYSLALVYPDRHQLTVSVDPDVGPSPPGFGVVLEALAALERNDSMRLQELVKAAG